MPAPNPSTQHLAFDVLPSPGVFSQQRITVPLAAMPAAHK